MKKAKRALSLLIAAIIVFGMAVTVGAAPAKTMKDFQQGGFVYGKFPQYNDSAYAALNRAIENDIWLVFNGVTGGLRVQGLSRDMASFSNTIAKNWVEIIYAEQDDGDWTVLTVTVRVTYQLPNSAREIYTNVNTYYINTASKAWSKSSADYDAYVKAKTATAPAVVVPLPASPIEQANEMFKKITDLPILVDEIGYVSLQRYAEALGGTLGFDSRGNFGLTIGGNPIFFQIDDSVWNLTVNANLNAPIYIDGDDVLVHASLVYPIYKASVTVNAQGVIIITTKSPR